VCLTIDSETKHDEDTSLYISFQKEGRARSSTGDRTIHEIAAHYEVHPNMISTWKRQTLEVMEDIFDNKSTGRRRDIYGEIKVLHAKIRELTVINDCLEKGLKG
jgi:transposase